MITKNIPAQTHEVILGGWHYDGEGTEQLTIDYTIGGEWSSHTFTKEESDNWTDNEAMRLLLCQKKGFTISN